MCQTITPSKNQCPKCGATMKSSVEVNWLLVVLLPMGIGFLWYAVLGGFFVQRKKECLACRHHEEVQIF